MENTQARALIEWIHSARVWGEKAGLDNMRRLLDALGNPQRHLHLVHVAGTNGKGSVCAMLESALRACGLRTGLYISPYLTRYNERVQLDGAPIADDFLVACGERVRAATLELEKENVRPTAFELGTALALTAFALSRVDVAVIETGLGGRLDPTNVISPVVCAITAIGMDHMEVLGDSLQKIAREKAGILKPDTPVALYPQPPEAQAVIEEVADKVGAPLLRAQDCAIEDPSLDARGADFGMTLPALGALRVRINLPGAHQVQNARLALCALSLLAQRGYPLDAGKVCRGMAAARWPGRLEWVKNDLLLDGAHNPHGARALADYLNAFCPDRNIVLVTGMMRDKQPEECAALLAPFAQAVLATQVDWPRALNAQALAGIYAALGTPSQPCPQISEALARAREMAGRKGLVLVAGSLYLVGAVRALLEDEKMTKNTI